MGEFGSDVTKKKNHTGKTHCDHDARGELRAEVVIQEPLERCVLLHDEDELCRRDDVWTRVEESARTRVRPRHLKTEPRILLIPLMFDETATA